MNILVLLAAGEGSRMQAGKNKVLLNINGKSILRKSAEAFLPFADSMIVVYRQSEEEQVRTELSFVPASVDLSFVQGGKTRQ